MQSQALLPELERIPLRAEHRRYSRATVLDELAKTRDDFLPVELAAGAEVALTGLFDARNVSDDLLEAYGLAFPVAAAEQTLDERYLEMVERGPESVTGFIASLKGKLAELRLVDHLEQEFPDYTFALAASPNQPGWDISVLGPDGADAFVQVKVGGADYAGDVLTRMQADPDVLFAASSEIRSEILASHPELVSQFVDSDMSNFELTSDVGENLGLLANNSGIDIPDELSEVVPYVTEIVLGVRLLYGIVKVERDLKAVHVSDRARVQAMQALCILQRYGVVAVGALIGTAAGGAAGAAIAGIGSVPGGIAGGLFGTASAAYLGRKLRPRMMEIATWLCRVTDDDLFYFRNKVAIDRIGGSLAQTALGV